jgi:DNA polymerase-3 subunit beta
MKVTLLTENIINFLPLIGKVLPSHSQVPILSNVLLFADSNGFFIKATDLEIGVEIKIPAKIETEGAVTIPGKEFIEAINSLPKDKISIEQEKDIVVLRCRENTVSFNTIPKDEFPQLFKEKGKKAVSFTKAEFIDIFSYLTFAVSFEETRPQLTGVLIDTKKDGVNFVATDGYRMSVKKIKELPKEFSEPLIVSVKLINEVMAIKNKDEVSVFINKEENQVLFDLGDVLLVGRMIEGSFPDYESVIPTSSKTTVTFDREELLQNVRLISVFARDVSNIVSVEIMENAMKLSAKSQGVGEGESLVECQTKGEGNKISFNIKYLHDLLKTVTEKTIVLRVNSAMEAALFEVKEKDFSHVIMPIQAES